MKTRHLGGAIAPALLALVLGPLADAAAATRETVRTAEPAPIKTEADAAPRIKTPTMPAAGAGTAGPGVQTSLRATRAVPKPEQDPLAGRARQMRELEHSRGLHSAREMRHDAAHLPARNGAVHPGRAGLGRPDRGRLPDAGWLGRGGAGAGFENPLGGLGPELPDNRGKTRDLGLSPSARPRDWMGGSASRGGTTTRRVGHGATTDVITTKRDGSGRVTREQRATYDSDGTFLNSVTIVRNPDGSERTTTLTRTGERYDMRTGERTILVDDTVELRDAHGNVTGGSTLEGRALGGEKHDPPAVDGSGIARTLDPQADADDGSVCWAMPWVCRGAPAKDPNRVNPGEPDPGSGAAPRLDPGESIVVNPSMERVREAGQAREFGLDGARRTVEEGTHVNPPEPGG